MTPVLELEGLSITLHSRRKDTMLVDGVSLSVAAGECLGILGESGSGKSMSMKAAMGLLDKNFRVSGSARFQGEESAGPECGGTAPPARRQGRHCPAESHDLL